MPSFSFTEKEWDKVRPVSLKNTGVSKAMRDVLKGVPKDLKALPDGAACDQAITALTSLDEAFDKAADQIKPKEDKSGAVGRIKGWRAEIGDGVRMIEAHKGKLAMDRAQRGAEAKLNSLLAQVESSTAEAKRLAGQVAAAVKRGDPINLDELTQLQQEFRSVERNSVAAVTKRGFVEYVKFEDDVRKSGVNPSDIPLPSVAATIKSKAGDLAKAVDVLGELIGQAVEQQSRVDDNDNSPAAVACKALVKDYKDSIAKLKKLASQGKTITAMAKEVAEKVKGSEISDTTKVLALATKLHQLAIVYEEKVLAEAFRARDAKGDIQIDYLKAAKLPGWDKTYNNVIRDWRASIFDVVRTCTIPVGAVKNQVDRALDALIKVGGTTAAQAQTLARQVDADRQRVASQYGSGG